MRLSLKLMLAAAVSVGAAAALGQLWTLCVWYLFLFRAWRSRRVSS